MKKIIKIVVLVLAIIAVAIWSIEHLIIVEALKSKISEVIDSKISISKIALKRKGGIIKIKDLKIYNPKGYKVRVMADVPRVILDLNKKTFSEPGLFFDRIEVHIDAVNIIRDKSGVVNLEKIRLFKQIEEKKEEEPFYTDRFYVKVGKVNYIDRMKEEGKQLQVIILDVEEEYIGMKNPSNIGNIIAYKIFFNGKIGNIGVNIQEIVKDLQELADKNLELEKELAALASENKTKLDKAVDVAKDTVKEQLEGTKEIIQNKVETINKVIDKTKEIAKEGVAAIKEKVAEEIDEKENKAGNADISG
jgi:hypothetical protein